MTARAESTGRDVRRSAVKSFFDLIAPWVQVDLPALQDVFGPTATDPDIQALIVSQESIAGAEASASSLYLVIATLILLPS